MNQGPLCRNGRSKPSPASQEGLSAYDLIARIIAPTQTITTHVAERTQGLPCGLTPVSLDRSELCLGNGHSGKVEQWCLDDRRNSSNLASVTSSRLLYPRNVRPKSLALTRTAPQQFTLT